MNFAPIDWVIVVGYLAVSLTIGVLGKRYIGNVADFLVASRELGLYIGIATLAATEIGTTTYMYNGELGYKYGFASFAAALISGIVMIIVGRTSFIIGRFRELKLMAIILDREPPGGRRFLRLYHLDCDDQGRKRFAGDDA